MKKSTRNIIIGVVAIATIGITGSQTNWFGLVETHVITSTIIHNNKLPFDGVQFIKFSTNGSNYITIKAKSGGIFKDFVTIGADLPIKIWITEEGHEKKLNAEIGTLDDFNMIPDTHCVASNYKYSYNYTIRECPIVPHKYKMIGVDEDRPTNVCIDNKFIAYEFSWSVPASSPDSVFYCMIADKAMCKKYYGSSGTSLIVKYKSDPWTANHADKIECGNYFFTYKCCKKTPTIYYTKPDGTIEYKCTM